MKKLIILALMVIPLTISCEKTGTHSPLSKELNIIYSGTPQLHEKEFILNVFIKNFEDRYGVKVNIEFVSQTDCLNKIENEQHAQNITTDVIFIDTGNMTPYINDGWMTDITAMIYPGSTFTAMYDGITNKGGERFFIPACFDIYVLAACVEALKYLPDGLAREDVINGITWEQYAQWAVNIAKGEGVGKTMLPANDQGSQLIYPIAGMGIAYGAGFPDFLSSGFKRALEIIAIMAEGNAFYPKQDQYTAPTNPMENNEVWLTFAHISPIGIAYTEVRSHWVIGAAPKGSSGAGSTSGAWCWGVQKKAPHADLAALWIDYVTAPHVNYQMCSQLSFLSPIKEIAPLLGSDDAVMIAGTKMLSNTRISSVPSSQYNDWNAVKLLYHEVFNQTVNTRQIPSEDFLQDLNARCQALKNLQN